MQGRGGEESSNLEGRIMQRNQTVPFLLQYVCTEALKGPFDPIEQCLT